ncbi:ketopantoate reductase family protein [Verminephrobacter eiseniae]|uniref:ketopantoate reductase family protein n=1 Tax=Verminephrobacter eiseniae TaxID=364317 RepID=UPI0022371CA8|nr:2-dehydropantoate 2-reductase [Verminephrobacter eiseniae]MCW5259465.1 ketopantoate reductase family protein [Verminephrobacter eiseniae]
MNRDILIWGAGAIGGTVGAYLCRAGLDVTFVDIDAQHVAAIRDRKKGLSISGPIDNFTVHADSFLSEELRGQWNRIFLCVKAHHTQQACEELLPYLAPDGFVVSLQNGLCERSIAEIAGRERTIGAFINFGADWIEAGAIMYGNRAAVLVGELKGEDTMRLRQLLADLKLFEPRAEATSNIWAFLWGKLAYGSLLFAQALGQDGIADCLERPEWLPLWRKMVAEVLAVAEAEGVAPSGFNGFMPDAFAPAKGTVEASKKSVEKMAAFNRPNAKTHSGIWRDLAIRKRKTEVDAFIGQVVAIGKIHQIQCPVLENIVEMIHEIENGRRIQSNANLTELWRKNAN